MGKIMQYIKQKIKLFFHSKRKTCQKENEINNCVVKAFIPTEEANKSIKHSKIIPGTRSLVTLSSYKIKLSDYRYMERDLKSYQIIASDKSNLLRKVHFLLKSVFQVTVYFILWEVGYFITTVINFVKSEHNNYFQAITK